MKKVLGILFIVFTLSGCKSESTEVIQLSVDHSKNPQLISVSVNGSTSEIVRVK